MDYNKQQPPPDLPQIKLRLYMSRLVYNSLLSLSSWQVPSSWEDKTTRASASASARASASACYLVLPVARAQLSSQLNAQPTVYALTTYRMLLE